MSAAKALAVTTGLPYVGVNHLEAHLHAAWLEEPDLEPPLAVLIVSGGHTLLVAMDDHGRYRVLGQTVDDAAGEAFDKVARFLGLGYPGGPVIDRLAREGDASAVRFPRPMLDDGLDFSFSGLKTAVVTHARPARPRRATSRRRSRRRSSTRSSRSSSPRPTRRRADVLVLGGGVAANSRLRARVAEAAATGRRAFLPPLELCTDNGAMIAAAAWWRRRRRRHPARRRDRPQPPPGLSGGNLSGRRSS